MFQLDLQREAGLSIPKEERRTEQVFAELYQETWSMSGSCLILTILWELAIGLISDVFQFVMLDLENSL